MPDVPRRPCCICRRWFRPDPRIGLRQQACRRPECQVGRRKKKQKAWRERNPDYFIARRIKERSGQDRPPEPLRLPPPLSRLPWDIAQSQFRIYVAEEARLADTLPSRSTQSQMRVAREWIAVKGKSNEVGVSPTGP